MTETSIWRRSQASSRGEVVRGLFSFLLRVLTKWVASSRLPVLAAAHGNSLTCAPAASSSSSASCNSPHLSPIRLNLRNVAGYRASQAPRGIAECRGTVQAVGARRLGSRGQLRRRIRSGHGEDEDETGGTPIYIPPAPHDALDAHTDGVGVGAEGRPARDYVSYDPSTRDGTSISIRPAGNVRA
uniref:Uncharacterized protein n=1 Tax=Mycena chlorophos TaxID=658473 RepID=A0ABQ0LI66_MYCCL|nr:predicted protein [Mycena chlorophos]